MRLVLCQSLRQYYCLPVLLYLSDSIIYHQLLITHPLNLLTLHHPLPVPLHLLHSQLITTLHLLYPHTIITLHLPYPSLILPHHLITTLKLLPSFQLPPQLLQHPPILLLPHYRQQSYTLPLCIL